MKITEDVTPSYVASLIHKKKVVVIYQGRSEAGPRALGNRSILFNPASVVGKDFINDIKGRERFRPLAATVMEEYTDQWFDMIGIKSSPYMTFSFQVRPEKAKLIPSVVHVDGSCRIQTVNSKQNFHYYKLIEAFNEITGIPMLLNTSFNLNREPIVETIKQAFKTFSQGRFNCLYCPEMGVLVEK